jgi:hypothetical protein
MPSAGNYPALLTIIHCEKDAIPSLASHQILLSICSLKIHRNFCGWPKTHAPCRPMNVLADAALPVSQQGTLQVCIAQACELRCSEIEVSNKGLWRHVGWDGKAVCLASSWFSHGSDDGVSVRGYNEEVFWYVVGWFCKLATALIIQESDEGTAMVFNKLQAAVLQARSRSRQICCSTQASVEEGHSQHQPLSDVQVHHLTAG